MPTSSTRARRGTARAEPSVRADPTADREAARVESACAPASTARRRAAEVPFAVLRDEERTAAPDPCAPRRPRRMLAIMRRSRWCRCTLLSLLVAPLFGGCKPAETPTPEPAPPPAVQAPVTASDPAPASEPAPALEPAPAREPAPALEPAPAQSTPAATPAAGPKLKSYLACGCGCCGGLDERSAAKECVDRKKGETLEQIKARDEQQGRDPGCAVRGCSRGTLYTYCK